MKSENYDDLLEFKNKFDNQLRQSGDDHALVFIAVKPKEKYEKRFLGVTIISDLKDQDLNLLLNVITKTNYVEIPQGE